MIIGLSFGLTKSKQNDEIIYTNIFLNEKFNLHDDNYEITILSASTKDEIKIKNKEGEDEMLTGHFADAEIRIHQKEESKVKTHTFDKDDF